MYSCTDGLGAPPERYREARALIRAGNYDGAVGQYRQGGPDKGQVDFIGAIGRLLDDIDTFGDMPPDDLLPFNLWVRETAIITTAETLCRETDNMNRGLGVFGVEAFELPFYGRRGPFDLAL